MSLDQTKVDEGAALVGREDLDGLKLHVERSFRTVDTTGLYERLAKLIRSGNRERAQAVDQRVCELRSCR
jgi:hypothetical protein